MRILGFMSGTSLDGVDAAILSSDGEEIHDFGPTHLTSFSTEERAIVKEATEQFVATGPAASKLLVEADDRSEEHTSELQSLMRISYAVFCFKKKIIILLI